jgi:thiol-disulfide isomerase/thioredoxin
MSEAKSLPVGAIMPAFAGLRGTDGTSYSDSDFADPLLVVVFSCNHCPYVQAYEERMIAFQREYGARGVRVVAVNANDLASYPTDSFEHMVSRATERGFNFTYLRDEEQVVAEAFGATHTPQFFLFDGERRLRYCGKMDDNWQNPSQVRERYLRDAVEALLNGKEPEITETFSIGCTIKWRA